jgi:anaerobic magnesium-protoporphyrin IX monomethyl ester cyclase
LLKGQGHEVELLNWYDIKNKPHIIHAALLALKPDLVGFSIFHANRWGGIQLAKIFKEHFPDAPIVFGGIGATFLDDHLRHFPWIDIIVRGEGEITFPALIHRIEAQKILRRFTRSDPQGRQHHSEKQGRGIHRGSRRPAHAGHLLHVSPSGG